MRINRRGFIAGAGATIAAASIGGWWRHHRRPSRPNIIFFIADDMRFDAAGFAGNRIIQTPALDQLSATGLTFDRYYVTTSICPTSRASMMTGEYVMRHGVANFVEHMREASLNRIFPRLMQAQGYFTGFVGKWGVAGKQPVAGFDHWDGFEGLGKYYPHGRNKGHLTDIQTGQALRFLKDAPPDKPFLLVVAYKAPHDPLQPQKRFKHLYQDITIPRPASDTKAALAALPPILAQSHERERYEQDMETDRGYEDSLRKYYQLITGMDESIGIILKQLEAMGMAGDTSVLFTSDNGLLLGEHELSHKWLMFEESIRVPLLVRPAKHYFPHVRPQRITQQALNIDLAPTILHMAGVKAPAAMQGMDLLPLALHPQMEWRPGFYYAAPPSMPRQKSACDGYVASDGWKYTHYYFNEKSAECLFNLADDPEELNNLAGNPDYQDKLQEMRQLMQEEKARLS